MEFRKERVFDKFDTLTDMGFDIEAFASIPSDLKDLNPESLRRQCIRIFGSYKNALKEYGILEKHIYLPTLLELFRCWSISSNFEVLEDTHYITELSRLSGLSYMEILSKATKYKEEAMREAISEFVISGIYPEVSYAEKRDKYYSIYYYIIKLYGSEVIFRESINL